MKKQLFFITLTMICFGINQIAIGAVLSEDDSTQPRGAPVDLVNGATPPQSLDSIVDGFRAPARFDGEITPNEDSKNPYRDWAGSIMANAMRDPAFLQLLMWQIRI
jgi:hypothetical protein